MAKRDSQRSKLSKDAFCLIITVLDYIESDFLEQFLNHFSLLRLARHQVEEICTNLSL